MQNGQSQASGLAADLGESGKLFQIMADCAPVALWMSGTDAKCVFFNQTWLRFTGRSMAQELGDGWAEGVHHEDLQRCLDVYLQHFNARKEFSMQYRLRRADGEYRWVLDRGAPRYEADGRFAGFIGSCVDISEIRIAHEVLTNSNARLETLVQERTAQLEQANKEMASFSYSVAHDLRAPLRKIAGFGQALENDPRSRLGPEGRDFLRRIQDNACHMDALISSLLKLARLTQQELKREEVNVSELAAAIGDDLAKTEPARRARFMIAEGVTAQADPELMQIIMRNLLNNAWKFTAKRDEAVIEFGALSKNGVRVYFVRDNGAGFDMAYHDKLFNAFVRLHPSSQFPGTGVGLATVQRAVQRHGGRIWANAAVDRGTAFYFTLGEGEAARE